MYAELHGTYVAHHSISLTNCLHKRALQFKTVQMHTVNGLNGIFYNGDDDLLSYVHLYEVDIPQNITSKSQREKKRAKYFSNGKHSIKWFSIQYLCLKLFIRQ